MENIPICDRHNQVKVRKKDGRQFTIVRCADPGCIHFTKEVTGEQCDQCPRHLATVEMAARLRAAKCSAAESTSIPQPPSLLRRTMTYAEAVTGWVAAGRPERSDEETRRIFQEYCSTCNWYDKERHICRGCGCRASEGGSAVFNKIRMATQHCPRRLW